MSSTSEAVSEDLKSQGTAQTYLTPEQADKLKEIDQKVSVFMTLMQDMKQLYKKIPEGSRMSKGQYYDLFEDECNWGHLEAKYKFLAIEEIKTAIENLMPNASPEQVSQTIKNIISRNSAMGIIKQNVEAAERKAKKTVEQITKSINREARARIEAKQLAKEPSTISLVSKPDSSAGNKRTRPDSVNSDEEGSQTHRLSHSL